MPFNENNHSSTNHSAPADTTNRLKHPSFVLEKTEKGALISVVFHPDAAHEINELLLTDIRSGETLSIQNTPQEDTNAFTLEYGQLFSLLNGEKTTVSCSWILSSLDEEDVSTRKRPVSLAEFEEVSLSDLNADTHDGKQVQFCLEGPALVLGLACNQPASRTDLISENHVDKVEQNGQDLTLTGSFTTRLFQVQKLEASIENQYESMHFLRTASFKLEHADKATHSYTYSYKVQLRCSQLAKQLFMEKNKDAFFTPYLLVHFAEMEAPLSLAAGTPADGADASLSLESVQAFGRLAYVFTHRVDASGKLQLCALLYDRDTLTYARERSSTIWLTRPFHSKEEIWLVASGSPYERSFNSWDFFRYIREQMPEKDVYYILDPSSDEWEAAKAEAGDRLLAYKSEEYIWKLLVSSVLITGGAPHFIYPFGTPNWDRYIRAKKVILPDHLLGLSDERWTFNQQTTSPKVHFLLTSSKTEKRFASDSLGFEDSAVGLTGLPYHAKLLESAKQRPQEKVLLFLPHIQKPKWRSYPEQSDNLFLSLAQNAAFKRFLQTTPLKPTIVLPAYKTEEAALFEAEQWTVIRGTSEEAQAAMLNSSVLVTDYHSMALDYGLLERPVFFYRPYTSDAEHTEEYSDDTASSLRSYHNELPGEIAEREDELIYLLEQIQTQNFEMSRKNRKKADALFENRDRRANERILEWIQNL